MARLAYGLAQSSAYQYHVQRLRWGQGSMQILRKLNPLTYPGLTIRQRLGYFRIDVDVPRRNSEAHLLSISGKRCSFFTGMAAGKGHQIPELLDQSWSPYVLLSIISFELLSRGTGWILISERYNMAKFWTYIKRTGGSSPRNHSSST